MKNGFHLRFAIDPLLCYEYIWSYHVDSWNFIHWCLVIIMCDYGTLRKIEMMDVICYVVLEYYILTWKKKQINGLKLIKWKVEELWCHHFYLNFRQR